MDGRLQVQFGEPAYLWLLVVPGLLAVIWAWRLVTRRRDVRQLRAHRVVPVRERFPFAGDLLLSGCLIAALTLTVLALARPRAPLAVVKRAGIDLIVLQDGSASMRVRDVAPDRWQRAMGFVRRLSEALHWSDDRIGLALFAHIAAPQVRLTRDVNTLLFFIDHLAEQPPFPIEDEGAWDTNMESGVYWGVRLIEKDEEIHGASPNAKALVIVSDGQNWSGEVQQSIALARARGMSIFVVGVGTERGGYIPEPASVANTEVARVFSTLDRRSLLEIASVGQGRYFELNRETDGDIANQIVDAARRRAGTLGVERLFTDLHRQCLLAAAILLCLGVPWARDQHELALIAVGAGVSLVVVWRVVA
jgi:Ca-activated chloride channel family protein